MNKEKKLEEYYRCKECNTISTIITIGDLHIGCANCGSRAGFEEKYGKKGKWHDYGTTPETEKLHRFLITGKI